MSSEPLSDEQREIRDLVRTLARSHVAPRAAEIDKSAEFPWDMVELLREHELFGLPFDEEHGGTGTGALMVLVAIEELSKVCATTGLLLAVQELGSLGLKLAGTEEQKARYLPRLASGDWLPAYALTEAGSGSDSAAMRTTVRLDGDAYVLDGSKRFITNAGVASLYTWGTEEQKRKYLVPQAKGERIATYGLTEPGAGSDVVGARATARREGCSTSAASSSTRAPTGRS